MGSVVACLLFAGGGGNLAGLPFAGGLPFLAADLALLVDRFDIVARFFLRLCVWKSKCERANEEITSHATTAAGRAAKRVL